MRAAFAEELQFITDQLVEMSRLAASALSRATQSALECDLELAERVITEDEHLDAVRRDLDNRAVDVLARQQPVATDLRTVVTAMRMSSDLERMGDLARHVAKLTRLRYPASPVPEPLRDVIVPMSEHGERISRMAGDAIAQQDELGAARLHQEDEAIDRLHREVFARMLSPDWTLDAQATIDATLLGRYYERFADHAVSVGERVVYLVTGEWGRGL
ncbi:phosphate signaling complex protein PhoU [Ornithinicoccus halotolerans]|uniref:phosphate signaling complex protein PhoU n=1 Tax=Ornithinicoccus halotolerans TaxID=1748220 RepID=UPI001296FAB0|nr:phosphate signaling complex protein PhoU [Ornithinicoccus halotolerans]